MPAQRHALMNTAMVIGAIVSVQVGGAFAATMFDQVGAAGMVFLRLTWAAVMLCAFARPRLHGRTRHDWMVMATFGALTGTVCLTGYAAVGRLPLGLVVTLQLLGPLGLAVAMSHRAREFVWVAVAVAGVMLLGKSGGHIDPWGVVLSLIGAVAWAGYILLSAETGRRFDGVEGLALAMAVAAVLVSPFGIVGGGTALLRPTMLLVGIVVALMTAVINFGLELIALREMPPRAFGVLMSLSPAMAALAGFLILHQRLSPMQLAGIALVIAASAATVASSDRSSNASAS